MLDFDFDRIETIATDSIQQLKLCLKHYLHDCAILVNCFPAGNLAVTGCEAHLTHSMLLDIASMSLSLLPPPGLFNKRRTMTSLPVGQLQNSEPQAYAAKTKPALQVTKLTVAITSMVVGYQTTVKVAAADRQREEDGALTLSSTHCVTLQEFTAEAYPASHRGALQMSNLAVTHQEARASGHMHHDMDILRASHFSVRVQPVAEHAQAVPMQSSVSHASAPDSSLFDQLDRDAQKLGPPRLAVKVTLAGWRTGFHADSVIGLCKAAGDVSSVVQETAAGLHTSRPESDIMHSRSAKVLTIDSPESATAPSTGDAAARSRARLSKLLKLPAVRVTIEIERWQTDIIVAEHIAWGVRVAEVQLKLDSRTLLALQQQQLQAQLAQLPHQNQAHSAELAHTAGVPDSTHPEEQSQQHSQGMSQRTQGGQEPLDSSERPSVVARVICLTLNKRALLQCGEIDASLNMWPGQKKRPSMSKAFGSSASLGSPRRQASLGKTQPPCPLAPAHIPRMLLICFAWHAFASSYKPRHIRQDKRLVTPTSACWQPPCHSSFASAHPLRPQNSYSPWSISHNSLLLSVNSSSGKHAW